MKKTLTLFVLAAITLTGCASSTSTATKACKTEIEKEISADRIDYKDFEVANMSEGLFGLSDNAVRDHSEDTFMGIGTIHSWNGSVEKKHKTVCYATVKNGKVVEVSVSFLNP